MMPNYLVIDIENDNSNLYKRLAGNFLYDPIIAMGYKSYNKIAQTLYKSQHSTANTFLNNEFCQLIKYDLLIGHNIKHDLLFLWNSPILQEWLKFGGKIWDTAQVEYILTGQEHQYPALRDIAVNKYGCKSREKLMESYWNNGVKTSDIPKDLVLEDVENDVLDTQQIFLKQYEEVQKRNILPLIEIENNTLLVTCAMEYNGMFVDNNILKQNKQQLEKQLLNTKEELMNIIAKLWALKIFNANSLDHLSTLFFGGFLKESNVEPMFDDQNEPILIKSGPNKGQLKTHKVLIIKHIVGLLDGQGEFYSTSLKKEGFYSTDETVLKQLTNQKTSKEASLIAELLLTIRGLEKKVSTYYIAIENLTYDLDSCVHPQFNHTATETGRLSCKSPNIQNQASDTLHHFVSRYK